MIDVGRLIFLYFIVNSIRTVSPVSVHELPSNDIIININKGYALRRIGKYSPNAVERIVHTFVPLNNLCLSSPESAICSYTTQSKKTNIFELVTFLTSRQLVHTLSSYDRDSVSRLIRKDISETLVQHHPDEIINNSNSTVHLINDHFYYRNSDDKALITLSPNNVINTYMNIPYLHPTPAEIILKQINNNKLDFDYLSNIDLKLLLTAVFSTIDTSHTISNVQRSLNVFTQLIIGQSVFALRYCSFSRQNSVTSQPCLAISTLFLSIPIDSVLTYFIYRLTPLPVVFNGNKYIYSNLPKVIGINFIDQTLIQWYDEFDTVECIFSPVTLCRNKPVSISLLKSSCLSQLLDDNKSIASTCEVARSQDIHQDIMELDNGIWLFFHVREPYYCQVHSTSSTLIETISINEAAIVRMPCEKKISCLDLQISPTSCVQSRIVIRKSFTSNFPNMSNFIVPIKNMSTTLVSTYQLQLQQSMKDIVQVMKSEESKFRQIIHDLGTYILSAICVIILAFILYIIKFIKYKLQREINNLEKFVTDIIKA
jgi:hypothetical protein